MGRGWLATPLVFTSIKTIYSVCDRSVSVGHLSKCEHCHLNHGTHQTRILVQFKWNTKATWTKYFSTNQKQDDKMRHELTTCIQNNGCCFVSAAPYAFFVHKKYSGSCITLRLNWCHMDYFSDLLATFLSLAVYGGSESSRNSSKCIIKNLNL